ncbi:hypothetical protein GCM10020220_086850 [Nonomuraea rubra]
MPAAGRPYTASCASTEIPMSPHPSGLETSSRGPVARVYSFTMQSAAITVPFAFYRIAIARR